MAAAIDPEEQVREAERLSAAPPIAEPPPAETAADRGAAEGPAQGAPRRSLLQRLFAVAAIDLGPLRRHRDFRLLFTAQLVSLFGNMITYVALPYQVFQLSRSSLAVGLLGLVELIPLLATAFVGGALADAVDRRRLVQLTELSLALASLVLVGNALLPRPSLSLLFVMAALTAALSGLQRPALEALTPRLVEREEMPAAGALSAFRSSLGMIAGPAAGGLLIASAGLTVAYAVDVATFLVSLLVLRSMRATPPPPDAERPSLKSVLEGLRYARSRPELLGTYLVDIVAMLFGMPIALFPALAEPLGGPTVLGLLYAATPVGSLFASATSGWTGRVHRHGLAILLAAATWGCAITAFGYATRLPVALFFLALAGAADMISGLFRMTIWNQTIPDKLRGRLAGIEMISYSSGPLLGHVESGVVAAGFGVRASVISGGVLCVAGVALCAVALPGFLRYDARLRGTP